MHVQSAPVAGGNDPLNPKLPSTRKGQTEPLEPLSPFTEESTALHSTEDLDAMLRKAEAAAAAEPARQAAPSPFADDEHTILGSAQELENLAKKAAPEPELPKSSANTVRRRTNPMGVAQVTGQMATVRASGSMPIPTAPAPTTVPPPVRAAAPATPSDDELFDAAFADPEPGPAAPPAPSRSHEPTPAPPVTPQRAREPTPAPPVRTREPTPAPPPRVREMPPPALRPAFPNAPRMEVEEAQRAFDADAVRPTAPTNRRGLMIAVGSALVLALAGAGLAYSRISAADERTAAAERKVTSSRLQAEDAAGELAAARARIEALKSANEALERRIAAQGRADAERVPVVDPVVKPKR
ncbi:MAG: hypothetical protein JWP01_540 [Myxococcales bacterium]|nr:hypothetical protein [Myxococcales bacterium]